MPAARQAVRTLVSAQWHLRRHVKVCVYIYIYMYTYIFTDLFISAHLQNVMHTFPYVCMCKYICMNTIWDEYQDNSLGNRAGFGNPRLSQALELPLSSLNQYGSGAGGFL